MSATVDSLSIKVDASARGANQQLDKLVQKMIQLRSTVNGINVGNLNTMAASIQNFSKAAAGLNQVKTSDFTRMAKSIEKLSNIRNGELNRAATAITNISKAFSGIGNVSDGANKIAQLAQGISKLGYKSTTQAIQNIPLLTNELKNMMSELSKAPTVSNNIIAMTNAMANLGAQASGIRSIGSAMNGAGRSGNGFFGIMKKGISSIKSFASNIRSATTHNRSLASTLGLLYAKFWTLKRIIGGLGNAVKSSMDYIEEYNYFNVTMEKIASEWSEDFQKYGYENADAYGKSFQERLTEVMNKMTGFKMNNDGTLTDSGIKNLGLDVTQMTNYAAGVAQVTNSVGLTGEASVVTSKALSMLAGDMSSFRNLDMSTVMNNFSSGLIGQSRALYKYGIDITNAILATYAHEMGIKKDIAAMTQREKIQLRIISILDQSKVAWGDLAKTINSPSNQLRLLQNNFKALARTIGNMFLPAVAKVLPYVNGLVIAIRRLFEWTASMLGINLKDVIGNSGGGYSDAFDGLEEDADNADSSISNIGDSADKSAESVKKLAKQLMGFDELNVITTNDNGSSDNKNNNNGDSAPIDLTDQLSAALADYEKVWNKAYKDMENDAEKFANKLTKLFKDAWISGDGTDIGTAIASWINKGIKWVNDNVDTFAAGLKKMAGIMATAFNGFVAKLKWAGLGRAIGDSMKAVIEAETHFFDTVNWLNLGKGIAKSLNAWIATGVIQSLFKNSASKIRAAIELAFGAITTFKFKNLGKAIGQGINDFFKDMAKKNKKTGKTGWQELGKSFSYGISGITTSIITALETVSWSDIGKAIGQLLSSIDFAKITWKFGSLAINVVKAIGSTLAGSFSKAPIETALIAIFAGLKLSGLGSSTLMPAATKFIATFAKSIGEKSIVGTLGFAFKSTVSSSLSAGLGGITAASLATVVAPFLDVLAGVLALDAIAYTISLKVNAGDIKKAQEWQSEIDKINEKSEELEENIQGIQDVIKNTNKLKLTLKTDTDEGAELQVLAKQYYKLSQKTKLTATEKKRLKEKSQELIEKIPELKKHIDKETGAYKGTKDELEKLVKKTKEYYKLQAADEALKENAKAQLENSKSLAEANSNLAKASKKYAEAKKKYNKAMATGGDYLNTKKQMESAEKAYKKADDKVKKLTNTSKKLCDQEKYLYKYIDTTTKAIDKDTTSKNKNTKSTKENSEQIKKIGDETKEAKKKVGDGVKVKTKVEKDGKYDKNLKEWKSLSNKVIRAKMNGASSVEFDALYKEWSSLTDEFITKTAKGKEEQAYKDMASTWKALQDKDITANAFGVQKKDYSALYKNWRALEDKNVSVDYSGSANATFWECYNKYKNLKDKAATTTLKVKYANSATKAAMQNPLLTTKGKVDAINRTVKLSLKLNGKNVSNNDLANLAKLVTNPNFMKSNPFSAKISGKASGGIFSGGSWHNIAKYAGGGLPGMGQMFVAREAGPELVGTIGGHTAVMNNNQIVASVSDGVFNALNPVLTSLVNAINTMASTSSNGNGDVYVQIDGDNIARAVRRKNSDYRKRMGRGMFD